MLIASSAVIFGFILLIWGADRFVIGASATARNLGVSPLIIGLTIVGFGTSAPEMLVSAIAAYAGNPSIGIGNALGSNITNIGLVLGVTALITPLAVRSETLKREFPILFMIMAIAYLLLSDGRLDYFDGVILLAGMFIMITWAVYIGLSKRDDDPMIAEFDDEIPKEMSTAMALLWLLIGITILLVSSRILVWGAVDIARFFGISDLIIGLTVIAIGTSLPELAASVMSALKGEHDIAIGNILGSNMFNLLAVLGLPGLILPTGFEPEVLGRDYPAMVILSVALFIMAYGFRGPGKINRLEGMLLLCGYFGYLGLLYYGQINTGA
jgi:cation:H+ antiporter